MLCPERARLFTEYRRRVNNFRDAVAAIQTVKRAADFQQADATSEKLRLEAEEAREALEQHRKQHHC